MFASSAIPRQLAFAFGMTLVTTAMLGCSGCESDDAGNTSTDTTSSVNGSSTRSSTTATGTGMNAGADTSTTGASTGSAATGAASGTGVTASSAGNTSGGSSTATANTTGAGSPSSSDSSASTTSASGAGGSGTSGGSVFPPEVTTPRIMIVGDSISAGPGCYKKYLVENLTENAITNYEFVGEYEDDCGGAVKHSAVSCTTSDQYTEPSFTVPNCFGDESFPGMSMLVETHDPDLIMIQLGVNDVWGGSAPIEPILNNYATLIDQARAHNPDIVVMVAQIHKIITDNCQNAASTTNAEALVMAIPAWAETVTTAESPVLVADLWTNSDAHDADDCVHPNDAGAQRMGLNWYNALASILR